MRFREYINNRDFWIYIFKFISAFCLLYFGTLAIIGFSVPGGYYSPFIAEHLNFVDWLRRSLLYGAKGVTYLFGFDTQVEGQYILRITHGHSIRMVYQCIGYGVMSFWAAFVFANSALIVKKIKWIVGGWILIWIINVVRISLLLIAVNKRWSTPLKIDHHTLFNIAAYLLILIMIYFFDRSQRRQAGNNKQSQLS